MRRRPDKRTAPGASWGRGGSGSANIESKQQSDSKTPPASQEQLLADLETVADWRDELLMRMARGQLILEMIGLSNERHDELIAEAQAFIRVCRVLTEQIPGSLAEGCADHEQKAAA